MGLVKDKSYRAPYWLPNGHLQTIYPSLFRKVPDVSYVRERLLTYDGDFLLVDWCRTPASDNRETPLVILSHGFEGDSSRPYITGMVRELSAAGFDCLAWNYRSCGGEMNLSTTFYHSGATEDLEAIVKYALDQGYGKIFLVGFSLGGNLTLKYLGERRESLPAVVRAACFSVPLDLEACSLHLDRLGNRIYQRRFLATLRNKIRLKALSHPAAIDTRLLGEVTSVYTFDDTFTAPLHGFAGAADYYSQCSAKNFLSGIEVPTLIINAANDPMVPAASLPLEEVAGLSKVDLHLTSAGGHCGFLASDGTYWSERIVRRFFSFTE